MRDCKGRTLLGELCQVPAERGDPSEAVAAALAAGVDPAEYCSYCDGSMGPMPKSTTVPVLIPLPPPQTAAGAAAAAESQAVAHPGGGCSSGGSGDDGGRGGSSGGVGFTSRDRDGKGKGKEKEKGEKPAILDRNSAGHYLVGDVLQCSSGTQGTRNWFAEVARVTRTESGAYSYTVFFAPGSGVGDEGETERNGNGNVNSNANANSSNQHNTQDVKAPSGTFGPRFGTLAEDNHFANPGVQWPALASWKLVRHCSGMDGGVGSSSGGSGGSTASIAGSESTVDAVGIAASTATATLEGDENHDVGESDNVVDLNMLLAAGDAEDNRNDDDDGGDTDDDDHSDSDEGDSDVDGDVNAQGVDADADSDADADADAGTRMQINYGEVVDGCTALGIAAKHGHIKTVDLLIKSGRVDVSAANKKGCTPLMLAAEMGRTGIVAMLLDASATLSVQDEDGDSALLLAANGGHTDTLALILEHGAAQISKTTTGTTEIETAAAATWQKDIVNVKDKYV